MHLYFGFFYAAGKVWNLEFKKIGIYLLLEIDIFYVIPIFRISNL